MRTTSIVIIAPALVTAAILASGPVAAKPVRTTSISGESAEAFCHGHGGGTDCVFCHRDHCHIISCSEGQDGKKYCSNTVSFRKANGGGGRSPVAGVASPGVAPPQKGHRPPVKVSGFEPPSGIKTLGGNNMGGKTMGDKTMGGDSAPVIGHIEAHHFGGGRR